MKVDRLGSWANCALLVVVQSDNGANLELEWKGRWRFAGFSIIIDVVPVCAVANVTQDSVDLLRIPWNRAEVWQWGSARLRSEVCGSESILV